MRTRRTSLPRHLIRTLAATAVAGTAVLAPATAQAEAPSPEAAGDCSQPGFAYDGIGEGFDDKLLPRDWTLESTGATPWRLDDPHDRGNHATGDEGYAVAGIYPYGGTADLDTTLYTPEFDLSAATEPALTFATSYIALGADVTAEVLLSVDGENWASVWTGTEDLRSSTQTVDLSAWADADTARLGFHYSYTGSEDRWWIVDDVFVGSPACVELQGGGIVHGTFTDAATGEPYADAVVTDTSTGYRTRTDYKGEYALYTPVTGENRLSLYGAGYASAAGDIELLEDGSIRADWEAVRGDTAPAYLSGTVTVAECDGSTVPAAGATLQVIDGEGLSRQVGADDNGEWNATAYEGTIYLVVNHGGGTDSAVLTAESLEERTVDLVIAPDC
ncbi:choice-of-anchor J domain-containing protein [Salininema proteolyticum]|uniref:Choice-of-anchor J domain-containing protein n=1 Tax=Salininema proteolyticum TaxID=1607685 RepID=A0ABV8U5P4_9ACTN